MSSFAAEPESIEDGPKIRVQELVCAFADARNGGELAVDSWDGNVWSGPRGLGEKMRTAGSPALVEFNGTLYCFYRGEERADGEMADKLCALALRDEKWQPLDLPYLPLSCSPGAIVFDGRLRIFHQDEKTKGGLWSVSWDGGLEWRHDGQVPGALMSESPAPVVYNDHLHVFYQGPRHNGELLYSWWDGSTWQKAGPVGYAGISVSPACAVFGGRLYVFRQGAGKSGHMWYSVLDGKVWAKDQRIAQAGMSEAPGTAVFDEQLYVAYQGYASERQLYYISSANGAAWPPKGIKLGSDVTRTSPALATF
jgi:hypothetical protein